MKRALLYLATLALSAGCQQPAAPVDVRPAPDFLSMVTSARVVELNFTWSNEAPLLPLNPPFSMSLAATHAATAGTVPGGIAFAGDTMQFSGQHGAPTIDALGHISNSGKLYGGLDATASESPAGLTALGIEQYPGERLVNRGVLLDVARFKGLDALDAGYEITPADLEGALERQGVEIRAGDSVLIRTGYGRFFESDKEKYLGFRPGIGAAGADWLGARNIFLTGMDTLTYDVAPEAGTEFPAHRMLIADRGIYIVENMNLDALGEALAGTSGEFVLVLNPLRIRGATASPLNAFALLP
jgi:kynurenine formamidase